MLGEGGRRRKVEERGRSAGEGDWRGNDEQANRNPNDVSFGLLPNLWLSQLLEKHNQVKSNHPLRLFHNTVSYCEHTITIMMDPTNLAILSMTHLKVLRLGGATRIREELEG